MKPRAHGCTPPAWDPLHRQRKAHQVRRTIQAAAMTPVKGVSEYRVQPSLGFCDCLTHTRMQWVTYLVVTPSMKRAAAYMSQCCAAAAMVVVTAVRAHMTSSVGRRPRESLRVPPNTAPTNDPKKYSDFISASFHSCTRPPPGQYTVYMRDESTAEGTAHTHSAPGHNRGGSRTPHCHACRPLSSIGRAPLPPAHRLCVAPVSAPLSHAMTAALQCAGSQP